MTTSWNDTEILDLYLNRKLPAEDRLLVEARLINESELKNNLRFQEKAVGLIKVNARRKLKNELESVHVAIFTSIHKKDFQHKILNLFRS
jgi:hypothetical protein